MILFSLILQIKSLSILLRLIFFSFPFKNLIAFNVPQNIRKHIKFHFKRQTEVICPQVLIRTSNCKTFDISSFHIASLSPIPEIKSLLDATDVHSASNSTGPWSIDGLQGRRLQVLPPGTNCGGGKAGGRGSPYTPLCPKKEGEPLAFYRDLPDGLVTLATENGNGTDQLISFDGQSALRIVTDRRFCFTGQWTLLKNGFNRARWSWQIK